jgi:hypothetical protein
MAAAHPQELLSQWSRETITAEMATGQIIQHLVALQAAIEGLQRRIAAIQSEMDQLRSAAPPSQAKGQHKAQRR